MAKAQLNKETSELLISAIADKKVWKEEQDKAFKEIAKNVEVKGFRKGNIPAEIVKKHVSTEEVMQKAITGVLDILVQEAAKEIDKDIMILDSPTYKVDKISDVELEVTFIYPVYPEIEMADYKKLGIKFEEPKFDKSIVKQEIEKIQKSKATLESKDGAIVKGDTATFDFSGTVDGVLFDGGTAEGYKLEIGSGQFIPGFEEQMVGLKKDDTKDVKVTFPAEYHVDDLKNKEAIFAVKINEVKTQKLPAIDEEFIKSVGVKEVKTEEELKAYIERVFKEQGIQQARAAFQKEAFDKILETTKINLPTQLVAKEMQQQETKFAEEMKQQGLSMEKYIEMTGVKPEALASQFKKGAEDRLNESLIFAEIAKAEKIELTDADYESEYKKLAKVYGQSEDSIKGVITKQQMQIPMTNDKVIEILIGFNK